MTTAAERASKCDIKQVVALSLADVLSPFCPFSLSMVEGLRLEVSQVFVCNGRLVLLGEVCKGYSSGNNGVENGVREFVLEPVAWQQPKAVSEAPTKDTQEITKWLRARCAICGDKWNGEGSPAKWGVPGVFRNTDSGARAEEAKDDNQYTLCRDCEKYTTMDPDTGEFFFTAEGDRLLVLRQRLQAVENRSCEHTGTINATDPLIESFCEDCKQEVTFHKPTNRWITAG